ncbi:hypothetical protein [Phycisphaera mikurensis]|uniref:DUF1772 domain-containing protein n=1 Tax=Phycisphaera mikurensis (strain NBRC 102666 / KCTC 22515 / FYK2301M01) TaxID=1142394 RepID=I0IDA6_PHYMF|nr:hypothetical protein [Phycisphaera mikurensis]MBB6442369.1 hypothetical protein [Phycisphaera mikurensis]BAM03244.1 hypothetical protein PSMK_10850 [Phycisphaera mikurensis NBRC 102666]
MSAADALVLAAYAGSVWGMVGLIWFVQRVHYPAHARVPADAYLGYQAQHIARTGPVVGPLMAVELGATVWLCLSPPPGVPPWIPWLGLATVAINWASTALLQIPRHRVLARGFDAGAARSLVTTNWIRTAAWTAHGVLAAAAIVTALTA